MNEHRSPREGQALTTDGSGRRALLKAFPGFISAVTAWRSEACVTNALAMAEQSIRWLAFYGVDADSSVLTAYDVVVLDHGFQGSVEGLGRANTRVCSYLSLGEINTSDPLLAGVDDAFLLEENPAWPGTRRVDLRHPAWQSFVLEQCIPRFVAKGFTGLMFDTLDTPAYLELVDAVRYRGMRAAAIALVGAIRARWPQLTLIMNRGYALLPDLVETIDAVIAEGLLTATDAKTGGFVWVDAHQVALQLSLLQPAVRHRPPLPILSLDYWYPDDVSTIADIYRRERALGHHPYVATRLLDRIVPE